MLSGARLSFFFFHLRVISVGFLSVLREREQHLHLPPVHLVGIETVSVNCALRFAVLYVSHLTPSRLVPSTRLNQRQVSGNGIESNADKRPPAHGVRTARIYAPVTSTSDPLRLFRIKNNMYMLDELIQLYSFAEDLDTYEHAAKELSTFLAGPVSLSTSFLSAALKAVP